LLKYGLSSIVTSIPQKVNTSFNVFPNPVSDKLIIEGDYLNAIEIRNLAGQLIDLVLTGEKKYIELDVSSYDTGIYIITGDRGLSYKFVKIR
jgi:hypothetical protein